MGSWEVQSRSALALAGALALLSAGCADGRAGGAPPAAAKTPVATQPAAKGEAASGASVTGKPSVPVIPAKLGGDTLTGKVPVLLAADNGSAPQIRDITFDTIKFPMDKKDEFKRSMITPPIEALAGQTVRIRGYILPSFKQKGLTQFILVRDNLECCFGPGAALYDCVVVEMEPGKATEFSVRPVAVEGVFNVNVLPGPTDRPLAIYHLRGTSVK